MNFDKFTIENMSYTDFISFLQEENRPSGGKHTVREIVKNTFINESSNVLEIGCTNGFSSFEISRLIKCNVIGIDINSNSIDNAQRKLEKLKEIFPKLSFINASAYELPFPDNKFDLIMSGNAGSFMNDQNRALKECFRVLKPYGFVATVPIWYRNKVPNKIIDSISNVIGIEIIPRSKSDWIELFQKNNFEIYYCKDCMFPNIDNKKIDEYVNFFILKEHIKCLSAELKDVIMKKWMKIIKIFRDNLEYASFSIVILRKRSYQDDEEIELFSEMA